MAVVLTHSRSKQVKVFSKSLPADSGLDQLRSTNSSIVRFTEFWDLMDTVRQHGYVRAAMSVVGRSTVGAWWKLREHEEWGTKATERQRKKLYSFYMQQPRDWTNIKDFQNLAYKLIIGAQYLRFFGQVAYEILRDSAGSAVGFDHLPGLVVPNVDKNGNFKEPAFIQYPTRDPAHKVEFKNPRDIVFIINPDWEGSPLGGSDVEALTVFNLPLDIHLQTAAREYMKNRDRPEVVYELSEELSAEAFQTFVAEMEARHRGSSNMGRSAVALQGEFKVHELRPLPDALPYQSSRKDNREEEMAVLGVSGAKLGLSESMASANLREMRREFHETNMLPMFKLIELGFYEQVHVREFDAPGWELKFNNPSFMTAVEQATVDMRYHQMGVLNPNEIRYGLGRPPREGGDEYVDSKKETPEEPQGSPPEGREEEPDAPSNVGEPSDSADDPVRGDQHDEEPRERDAVLKELKLWRSFAIRRTKRGKSVREFNSDIISPDIRQIIYTYLKQANSVSEVASVFDDAIDEINQMYEEGLI